jgi:hypothetical protein
MISVITHTCQRILIPVSRFGTHSLLTVLRAARIKNTDIICAYIRSEGMQGRSCPSVQRLHFRNIFTGFKLNFVLISPRIIFYELTCIQTGSGAPSSLLSSGRDIPKADGA